MASGILAGPAHLHARGLVHRDLKPENVLLQGETPRIADFGLARVLATAFQTSGVAGTPAYMAPEAWNGVRSVPTDLWSVGVMLHELLSGQRPFPQTDREALWRAVLKDEPAPLPAEVPEPLARVVLRPLQKHPDQRYATAGEMLADLRGSCNWTLLPTPSRSHSAGTPRQPTPVRVQGTSGVRRMIVFDNQKEDPMFQDWGSFCTVAGLSSRIRLRSEPDLPPGMNDTVEERAGAVPLQLRAFGDEQVGVNKALSYLVGRARFDYQAIHSGSSNPNLLFCVIPMQGDEWGGERLIEVGSLQAVEPENAYSPYRQRFFVPETHVGDGRWHVAEIDFDFRSVPTTAYTILAPRVNEGCPRPGPGILLIKNIQLLVPSELV
jgi:serine/threonine protein kinase